jgi:hypothetical protein
VILSAFVPTLIAQQIFRPAILDREESEALGEEDLSIIHSKQAPGRALAARLPALLPPFQVVFRRGLM